MSQIITEIKCSHCNRSAKTYMSFGHPEREKSHILKCMDCGGINEIIVPPFPLNGKRAGPIRHQKASEEAERIFNDSVNS